MRIIIKTVMVSILLCILLVYGCKSDNDDREKINNLEKKVTVLESKLIKIDSVLLMQQNNPREGLVQVKCSLCSGAGRCDYCLGTKKYGGYHCSYCTPAYSRTPTGLCKKCKGTGYILTKVKI